MNFSFSVSCKTGISVWCKIGITREKDLVKDSCKITFCEHIGFQSNALKFSKCQMHGRTNEQDNEERLGHEAEFQERVWKEWGCLQLRGSFPTFGPLWIPLPVTQPVHAYSRLLASPKRTNQSSAKLQHNNDKQLFQPHSLASTSVLLHCMATLDTVDSRSKVTGCSCSSECWVGAADACTAVGGGIQWVGYVTVCSSTQSVTGDDEAQRFTMVPLYWPLSHSKRGTGDHSPQQVQVMITPSKLCSFLGNSSQYPDCWGSQAM